MMREVRSPVVPFHISFDFRRILRRLQLRHLRRRRRPVRSDCDPRPRHVGCRLHVEQPLGRSRIHQLVLRARLHRQRHGLRHVQPGRLVPLSVPNRHRNQPGRRRLGQVSRVLENRRRPQHRSRRRAVVRVHSAWILRMSRDNKSRAQHPSREYQSAPETHPALSTP